MSRHKTNFKSKHRGLRPRLEALELRLAPAIAAWDGGGLTTNWTEPANWVGDSAPSVGDDLEFPAGANPASKNNSNDFAANTLFNSLSITDSDYIIGGNAITLGPGGLSDSSTGFGAGNRLNLSVVLPATRDIVVSTSGRTLFFDGIGVVSGAGGITKLGAGRLNLGGSSSNTYTGTTTVHGGALDLSKTSGDAIDAGSIILGDADPDTEMVVVQNSNQIADSVPVTVNSSGVFFLLNNIERIGALTVDAGNVANSGGMAGSQLTVASLTMTGGNVDMGGGFLILNGNVTTNASATTPVIDGNVTWGGARTFTVADGTAFDDLAIFATVSGGPGVGIIKAGPGRMALHAANTNEGSTSVSAGTLALLNATALGDTVNGSTTVNDGATLELRNIVGSYAPEFLVLNGAGIGGSGALFNQFGNNTWTGTINMGATVQIGATGGTTLDIASSIITGGTLTKVGLGTLAFSGATPNTFGGATIVTSGTLRLNKSAGVDAVRAGLIVGDADGGSETVIFAANNQIPNFMSVTVNTNGVLDLNGFTDTVAALSGTGHVNLATGSALTVGDFNANGTFSGRLGGSGALTKIGSGSQTLSGASPSYSGATTINAGSLLVTGSIASSAVIVNALGTLGGGGTVGPIAVNGGTVSPGLSPGVLSVAGNATFMASSVFAVELNGTTPGSTHDQLLVQGVVDLGGANLSVTVGFASVVADHFVIIDNDGADAVVGTFAGLAEGATFSAGGNSYRITYVGGTGNDVELIRLGIGVVAGNLIVDGSDGNDDIRIESAGAGAFQVFINDVSQGSFTPASNGSIIIHGLSGDDDISAAGNITAACWFYGDAGDDRLKGGAGHDALLGGVDDDLLVGGNGRDFLIGGAGADRIVGNADEDILIAGATAFDNHESALGAVMAEWTRTDQTYAQRVAHLENGGGLNGTYLLVATGPSATVYDDSANDKLTGSSGTDWFFADLDTGEDKITDLSASEFAEDLDFINS